MQGKKASRKKRNISLLSNRVYFLILCILFVYSANALVTADIRFQDVNGKEWYAKDILTLAENKNEIIKGFPDGTFRAESKLGIDQLIAMLVRATGEKVENHSQYWATGYLNKAKELGLLQDGDFADYKMQITREQMAVLILRYLEKSMDVSQIGIENVETSISDFKLVGLYEENPEKKQIYQESVKKAYVLGILTGYEDGRFAPQGILNRAEASVVIMRLLDESRRIKYDSGKTNVGKEKTQETDSLIVQASSSQGVSVLLGSEKPNQESFDVGKGIPTGEKIYVQVIADRYLLYIESKTNTPENVEKSSSKTNIEVSDVETANKLSYSEITKAYVYAIESAEVSSPALPNGKLTLTPQNYQITASMTQGGYQNGKTQNASLTVDGHTFVIGEELPPSEKIAGDVLYREGIVIPETAANSKALIPTVKIRYRLILSHGEDYPQTKEISGFGNPVSLHTPTVCYPKLVLGVNKPNEAYMQKKNQTFFVKEESFAITYPTVGKHLDIKGYGYRDYAKYIAKRQIQFSFDVYVGKDYNGTYLKAGQWYDFPVQQTGEDKDTAFFFIPSWVPESENHKITFRSLPINLREEQNPSFAYQANLDISKYKAVESFDVSIFGRFVENRILNIGEKEKKADMQMPVYPSEGKLAGRLDGISLGVPIDFVVTTNHDLFYREDYLLIQPKYYFVDKQGKKQEVDLYYHNNQILRKINVANKEIGLKARIKDYAIWIENKYFDDTAKILEKQKRENKMTFSQYIDAYISNYYVPLGNHAQITVGERLKLYSGRQLTTQIQKPEGVKAETIHRSRQNWYFRFYLPKESYVVPKGTDLKKLATVSLQKEPFLHNGYILVELEFQVYKNGELLHTYRTVPKRSATIPYLAEFGDSFFYDTERRSSIQLN